MSVKMSEAVRIKDPTEVLSFTFTWTDQLNGDTISTSSWSADSGITVDSDTNTTTAATVVLSGGTDAVDYFVTNAVVTAGGLTMERSIHIKVRTR